MSTNLGWSLTPRMRTRGYVRNAESDLGVAMKNSLSPEVPATNYTQSTSSDTAFDRAPLANRLLTASEVAAFVGCHEESVHRAYLCGQLKRHRFGVRSCRFDPADDGPDDDGDGVCNAGDDDFAGDGDGGGCCQTGGGSAGSLLLGLFVLFAFRRRGWR